MFTTEYESAKRSQDQRKTKDISTKKTWSRPIRMYKCMPRSSQPKKTKSKLKLSLSQTIKARTAFHPDLTLELNKEPIGHDNQRSRSCRHTWCRAQFKSASQIQKVFNDNSSSSPPPMELKPLPSHLKYAYLDTKQQLPVIIANNLHQEQEDKLLQVLRKHKKAIGWKLSDLPGINPSICMYRILMEEEAKPIRQHKEE
ncbi:hypothetical protein CR513_30553, partial [Mucuna pruriens]